MSSNNNIASHKRMIESPEFERAMQFAQLQYMRRLHEIAPDKLDAPGFAGAAAMCFERLQGMEDFIKILNTLADAVQLPEPRVLQDNLEHKN